MAKLIIGELKSVLLDMQNNAMAIMKKMSELSKIATYDQITTGIKEIRGEIKNIKENEKNA
ncbi:hypothetical protein [Candidatus Williamhamiltonella defendens]|uniref:hypothetical protein n=1 Tax=Candidatus Williamhamiltonella defendens TaxID=138072 RepID=UPI00130E21D3|nr:hypothetical protein [Candidatus Hamiltonella defensa]